MDAKADSLRLLKCIFIICVDFCKTKRKNTLLFRPKTKMLSPLIVKNTGRKIGMIFYHALATSNMIFCQHRNYELYVLKIAVKLFSSVNRSWIPSVSKWCSLRNHEILPQNNITITNIRHILIAYFKFQKSNIEMQGISLHSVNMEMLYCSCRNRGLNQDRTFTCRIVRVNSISLQMACSKYI